MNKIFLRNIIITVVVIALIIGGAVGIVGKNSSEEVSGKDQSVVSLQVNMGGVVGDLSDTASDLVTDVTGGNFSVASVLGTVKEFVYSDTIVNVIMSLAYPLLKQVLTDLNMLEFAHTIDLYYSGPSLAEQLGENAYTCLDKDGTRKALNDVLNSVGDDWTYMDTEVSYTKENGSSGTTTLWNSIEWGVTDEESFFTVMGEMSKGLRGVLEVCIQGKTRVVNVNVLEVLLDFDAIPIRMDAADIYNESEKTGYELCLVRLFNMLGLVEGEYPSVDEYCGYTEISDMWKGILQPVFAAVDKITQDPMNNLTSLLVNFANAVESGELVNGMRALRMDAKFNPLAALVMGYEDGLLFNLGQSLVEMIESMGIKLSGDFNTLLDSLLIMITKSESADLPNMDVATLITCATAETLTNGNTYYVADAQKVTDFLIEYVVLEGMIEAILQHTSLAGTQTATDIVAGVADGKAGVIKAIKTLANALLFK
ncbi:MAG: hypothetical protein IKM24_10830 [Clostridia bacterium]|nr:hypothetical protein [Clostridia bacterium]